MHFSILSVGSADFFAKLPSEIRHGSELIVEIASSPEEARHWIEVRPPDILIVQACLDENLELCRWLKQQKSLAWIYCILVEDRPQKIAQKNRNDLNWEVEQTATILEEAADAYVWFTDDDDRNNEQIQVTARLVLAHIQVGLRKVKKYRDLMQTNDVLSAIAYIDPLTELNNRRALDCNLVRQIRSSRTYNTPLSLIMLDVDYFKTINDTYGHLVGDRILKLLGSRLRYNLRSQDIPFRYGGEEFIILLQNLSRQEAFVVAHRLQRIVSEQPFTIDQELSIPITISLGISCLQPSDDAEGVELLTRADSCLLRAKAAGRNCIVDCEQ